MWRNQKFNQFPVFYGFLFPKSKMHAIVIWLGDCEDDLCIVCMNVHSKNLSSMNL